MPKLILFCASVALASFSLVSAQKSSPNKINTPLYGIKGRDVLAGKKVDAGSLPEGITAYQEALQKYYSRLWC